MTGPQYIGFKLHGDVESLQAFERGRDGLKGHVPIFCVFVSPDGDFQLHIKTADHGLVSRWYLATELTQQTGVVEWKCISIVWDELGLNSRRQPMSVKNVALTFFRASQSGQSYWIFEKDITQSTGRRLSLHSLLVVLTKSNEMMVVIYWYQNP